MVFIFVLHLFSFSMNFSMLLYRLLFSKVHCVVSFVGEFLNVKSCNSSK
jgi:hypothetical protein